MKTVDYYISLGGDLIKENNLDELKNIYNFLKTQDLNFDIGYLYQKLFLKACNHANKSILSWFLIIYEKDMSVMDKIAYKHTMIYGKYLIAKKKNKTLLKWYDNCLKTSISRKLSSTYYFST